MSASLHASPAFVVPDREAPHNMESDSFHVLHRGSSVEDKDGQRVGGGETVKEGDGKIEAMDEPQEAAGIEDVLIPSRARVRVCCVQACKRC